MAQASSAFRSARAATWTSAKSFPPRHSHELFEDLTYRRVFLDGRPLPDEIAPGWIAMDILASEGLREDPKALVQRWVVPVKFEFDADTEMLEYGLRRKRA
jgi:hypothetical protein